MIEVQHISKKFKGNIAVRDVSFQVKEGEKLVLLGTSGSGKTTLLKMINRLIEPSSGKIIIQNENVLNQKPEALRKKIGYVIQNSGLFPHYTVAQNVAIVPKLLKWQKEEIEERTQVLLEMLSLPYKDYAHRYPHELSGGQKQRVGIARALAVDPPLMLMDEPFGALDPITRGQIHKEFRTLESLRNKTIVMVTHDVFEAIELGDKICLLDKGEVQQIGSPKELIFNPQNKFVDDFFQTHRFQLELKVTQLKDILPQLQSQEVSDRQVNQFELESDLLEVLESKSGSSAEQSLVQIYDENQQKTLVTNHQEILEAFYKAH